MCLKKIKNISIADESILFLNIFKFQNMLNWGYSKITTNTVTFIKNAT
jgi:hypothetical protein